MSGHSKWHSIKHKKGAADAKRGKVFTKHAKLIAIAAGSGGDPEMNPSLRSAIINAKVDNVPNANIEKAVKKGCGDDKDAAVLVEAMYEAYGPEGTAILIEVITDNKNRAVTSVKTIVTKNGGRMGEAGSVSWMFERKGLIIAKAPGTDIEESELAAIDAGADDVSILEGLTLEILTKDTDLMKVRENLEKSGFVVEKAEISFIPKNTVKIVDFEKAKKILNFMDAIDEDEDVSNVYSNFDIAEEIMESM